MNHAKTLLIVVLPSIIWGILFIMANPIFEEVSPIYFAIVRFLPSTAVALIILYFVEGRTAFKVDRRFLFVMFIGAVAMIGFNVIVWIGIKLSSGVMGAIFQPIQPLFAIIVSFILFRQKFNALTFITIVIAFFGVFFAASEGNLAFLTQGDPRGFFLIFIGSFMVVFTGIYGPRFKDYSVLRFTVVTNGSGVCALLIFAFVENSLGFAPIPSMENVMNVKWELLYTGILAGTLPNLIWYKGAKIIGAVNMMLVSNLVPVVTISGTILVGFGVSIFEVIGTVIIFIAMGIHYVNVQRTTHAL
ncbi:MAG: DMT family transporter [Alphaproteobacteria bacterium]|jgi:drug/metabolite transporter (DMT)-like permease|nr:DMT family transporter [Alphaproteobacteria bacterium]